MTSLAALAAVVLLAWPAGAQQGGVAARAPGGGSGAAAPEGWFGVDVQTVGATAGSDGRLLISADYPRVVSVEPGSPAARAGLAAGDRLLTIAGVDLRSQALDLRRILQPGNRVAVRVERDGVQREVTVVITARPASFTPGTSVVVAMSSYEPGPAQVAGRPGAASRGAGESSTLAAEPIPAAWSGAGSAPGPSSYLFGPSPNVMVVAGAEVMRPAPSLQAALGVGRGVYVVSVAPRTPAERSGVRAGDVLLSADGLPVDEPAELFRVLRDQTDNTVRLEVVRDRRQLTLELRW